MMNNKRIKTKVYIYNKRNYEEPPISNYYIDSIEYEEEFEYITIRRKIPTWVHLLIITAMISTSLVTSYLFSKSISKEDGTKHIVKVPNEIYYDERTSTIDLDITNSMDNKENITIKLKTSNNNKVAEFDNIMPGYAIGAIPVEYEFKELPDKCKIEYSIIKDGMTVKTMEISVLLVDRKISDKDVNNDF